MAEVNDEISRRREVLAEHYKDILNLLGENTEREGLVKTPTRVAKAMQFLTKGYGEDPEAVLRSAMFKEEDYKQMVIVKDIDFFSLCEHHMLPFFGKAHVAYIPKHYITGLSKIPEDARSPGRDGRDRGATHVHANARRREAELPDNYVRFYRFLPTGEDARGVHEPDQARALTRTRRLTRVSPCADAYHPAGKGLWSFHE